MEESSRDQVVIDHKFHYLRDYDSSLYVGMNIWIRPVGSKYWIGSDYCGRAYLTPGITYETITCPEGMIPEFTMTFIERVRMLIASWL